MECAHCLRPANGGVLLRLGNDIARVCSECAARIRDFERQAMLPLVAAELSVFLDVWSRSGIGAACTRDAQRFWTDLQLFGDLDEKLQVAAALEMLLASQSRT
jgi:hypothetical protein